jgi:hypothetical protein
MSRPEIFAKATLAINFLPIVVGINAVLRPASALRLLNYPVPIDKTARRTTYTVLQMYGARNIAMGLSTLAVWCSGDRRTLGWVMLAGIPLATIDGFVTRQLTGIGEWGHWSFIPVSLGLAGGLLGWY